MKLLTLPITDVKPAPWNPPHRSTNSYVSDLVKSIKKVGQLVPVLVYKDDTDGKYQLIDGHRRYRANQVIGNTSISCIVTTDKDVASKYAEVNNTAKRISSQDRLSTYLVNPDAVSSNAQKECAKWDMKVLKFVVDKGGSLASLKQASRTSNQLELDPVIVLKWMVTHNLTYALLKALEEKTPLDVIKNAIAENKPLKRLGWGTN